MSDIDRLFGLDGKVALITGARTGLGRAMAAGLARAGADIVGLGSRPMPETAAEIAATGRRFVEVLHDLTNPTHVAEVLSTIEGEIGPVDILVNNAGQIRRADLLDFSLEDWNAVLNVNLTAAFLLSQAVARQMVERGAAGRIINIASLLSFQGGIRVASYTAAKHGILGLTRLMANELAPAGITVNAIAPGYIATDNTAALRQDADRSRAILERIPAARWGVPDDLMTALLFLAAPGSGYVTGSVVTVDGGWMAR
jgi:2-dehydro-3-deoxy-D-gluconate 5-dehydrogenase